MDPENSMFALALHKISRARSELAPGELSPEMGEMEESMRGVDQAAGELEQAMLQLLDDSRRTDGSADAFPLLFKGLAHQLHAIGTGVLVDGDVHSYNKVDVIIQGLEQRWGDICGGTPPTACRPGVVPLRPDQGSISLLLMLCRAARAMGVGISRGGENDLLAFQLLSTVISAAWPAARGGAEQQARRQMAGNEGVPVLPAAPPAPAPTPEPTPALAQQGNGQPQQQEQGDAQQAQQAPGQPQVGPPPEGRGGRPTAIVTRLAADLAAHCPDISVSTVWLWAVALRLQIGSRMAQGVPQTVFKTLACDLQQLLSAGAPMNVVVLGGTSVCKTCRHPDSCRALLELFRGALPRAVQDKRWLAAAGIALAHSTWCCYLASEIKYQGSQPDGRRRKAEMTRRLGSRQQLVQEAGQLLQRMKAFEARAKQWAPTFTLTHLRSNRSSAKRILDQLAGPDAVDLVENPPEDLVNPQLAEVICSGCRRSVMHARRCTACRVAQYCSRECQKQDWKQHKLVCAELAGGQGGGG